MARTSLPIQHGTRQGYRKGCRSRENCPGNEHGVSCLDAANQYNRDMREAHRNARPGNARTQPRAQSGSTFLGIRRSVNDSDHRLPGSDGTFPQPDMPTEEPPDSLRHARVEDDPEPANSDGDFYNDPPFLVTPKIRTDVHGKLALFAAAIGMPFEMMDPYCGQVFAQNCDQMIAKLLPIICRSEGAVRFLTATSGGWLEWIAFLQAAWPVCQAIYLHHLARSTGQSSGPSVNGLTPPQPSQDNFNYSVN